MSWAIAKKRTNKYGNHKIRYCGEEFDSQAELQRYAALKLVQRSGRISELRRQVKYVLIPKQYDDEGKLIERECSYVADFTYLDENGRLHVEDVKGVRTKEYIIKRKMMLYAWGIRVEEVEV